MLLENIVWLECIYQQAYELKHFIKPYITFLVTLEMYSKYILVFCNVNAN